MIAYKINFRKKDYWSDGFLLVLDNNEVHGCLTDDVLYGKIANNFLDIEISCKRYLNTRSLDYCVDIGKFGYLFENNSNLVTGNLELPYTIVYLLDDEEIYGPDSDYTYLVINEKIDFLNDEREAMKLEKNFQKTLQAMLY